MLTILHKKKNRQTLTFSLRHRKKYLSHTQRKSVRGLETAEFVHCPFYRETFFLSDSTLKVYNKKIINSITYKYSPKQKSTTVLFYNKDNCCIKISHFSEFKVTIWLTLLHKPWYFRMSYHQPCDIKTIRDKPNHPT